MDFQVSALDIEEFTHLFAQGTDALSKIGIQRIVVDSSPGYPCRISLQDADVTEGESLETLIETMLANESADYLHVHNARLGCYLALVARG